MLNKETEVQKDLRDLYGYFNYTVFEEITNTLRSDVKEYKNHFMDLAKI